MSRVVQPSSGFPRCAACGEVVGAYERAVVVLDDGEQVGRSVLELTGRDVQHVYHEPCVLGVQRGNGAGVVPAAGSTNLRA